MSHNDNNPQRAAWRHRPAVWAILAALVIAALAMIFFAPLGGGKDTGSVTTIAPGTSATSATDGPTGAPAAPAGGAAPGRN